MQFRLPAPIDGEADKDGEDRHVAERNTEKGVRVSNVHDVLVETAHDDGDREAQRHHDGGEPGAEPAEETMPLYLAYADERRLQDEEHDPQGEGGGVNPQEEGPRNCGMEEVLIDSTTEARDDDGLR